MVLTERGFCQIKKIFSGFGCCFLVLGLAGCANDDMSDLTQYIQSVKAKPKGTIQPLPEIKIVEPFIFNPEGLRDPFRPVEIVAEESGDDIPIGNGLRPDTTRRKEELEAYSLDTLRMVGTLTMDNGLWAMIKASDGTIHRVQKGNHMGRNYGEIIRILDDRVELMEIVSDKPGTWLEKQTSIALAE
ncbi:MAG: pilus assembly protein PilP [Methylococcales bacterium]|nr:pilus assembly protein PilP [Methylococcales bacterium]